MEDKSIESYSTSTSSLGSRKTSNFFPNSTKSNNSPNSRNFTSAPITPVINNLGAYGYGSDYMVNGSGPNSISGVSNGLNNGFGITQSSMTPNGNYYYGSQGPSTKSGVFSNNTMYYPSFDSNQSTPLFNDYEFVEFKSPPLVQRRASSFSSNFSHDIWGHHNGFGIGHGSRSGSGSKTPYRNNDELLNFPLEAKFETALEFGTELNESVLELDLHLNLTIDLVFEELAPDQLPNQLHSLVDPTLNPAVSLQKTPEYFQPPMKSQTLNSYGSYNSNHGQSSRSSFGQSLSANSHQSSNQSSYSQPSPRPPYSYNSYPGDSVSSIRTSTSSTGPLEPTDEEVIIKLPACKPIATPELNIQKYSESFSSTFYKRNKNGYMYIKELNDDLIKLEDDYFHVDIKFGSARRTLMISVNDISRTEFITDFKIVKKKTLKRYSQ